MTCVKLILCSVFVLAICHIVLTEDLKPGQGTGTKFCGENCDKDRARCNVVNFDLLDIEQSLFQCECLNGYTGDGIACKNIDECAENRDNCDNHAKCNDTVGSFSCSCEDGWKDRDEKPPGVECDDINECANATMNDCGDTGTCDNTPGSYSCKCAEGYKDPPANTTKPCLNINECSEGGNDCDSNAMCKDTDGSFTCTCNEGYTGNGTLCDDVDECKERTHNCDVNANCTDAVGSFKCTCKEGFSGDGTRCDDINECSNNSTNSCSETLANCINTNGSYTCQCIYGYTGDGVNCTLVGQEDKELQDHREMLSNKQAYLKVHLLSQELQQLMVENELLDRKCARTEQAKNRGKREVPSKQDLQTQILILERHISEVKRENHILSINCGALEEPGAVVG